MASVSSADAEVDRPDPSGRWRRTVAILAVLSVAAVLLVRGLLVQAFVIPTGSMEPTLLPGDRVLVWRMDGLRGSVQRGDVIVFDGTGLYSPEPEPARNALAQTGRAIAAAFGSPVGRSDYVKRVIGVPGDRVTCCDSQGRLSVNGTAVIESYLAPGMAASESNFDIVVPEDRLWVMGDNRPESADSRAHLGDPAATIPLGRVVGTVRAVWWPLDHTRTVSSEPGEEAAR